MIKTNKLNIIFSTLNFVLCFVGYQLATSFFLPASSDIEGISRTVTIPYRAFALVVSLLVIFLNFRWGANKKPKALKVFLFFWFALIIRIFYDTYIRIDVNLKDMSELWLFIFGICLLAIFSIITSYENIDLNKSLKWIYLGTCITLLLTLFSNQYLFLNEGMDRVDANIALNTISFGHIGTSGVLLSIFILSRKKLPMLKKIIVILFLSISFFSMLRAGSRSPIVALIIVLLFWIFARRKNIMAGTSIIILGVLLLFIFVDPILNFIGDISPVMEARLQMTIYGGDTSERDPLFKAAIQNFLDNPILGKQFAFFDNFGGFGYSHNIVLDAFMGLGFLGGIAMIYILWIAIKNSYVMIKNNDPHFWICLILIQQIILSMFSGAIYYDQLLNVLITFIFIYYTNNKHSKNQITIPLPKVRGKKFNIIQ